MGSSAAHLSLSPFLSLSKIPTYKSQNYFLPYITRRTSLRIQASGGGNLDLLGDFGARDPFPAEIESQFCDKVLGNVVGWKLVDEGGALKLHGMWKVRDEKCGEELINRIMSNVESTGHLPTLHFQAPNQVIAQLSTPSIGGLSINDFIVAAKIDEIKVSDLQPRIRVWA
ncbi:hypothetical protein C2S53_005791 [Perilla frutescens var. hirtella]|uniref:4a-hydroxytetrahydrobiopterin dehydratase n=1 Tax=Perilla frutescens var. hirtella TaxID=608512 RepID=A0AAD4JBU7_PERFH|nr:hypothetical protein C2S53_005791 [Perilla frutescens var. hirtella]